MSRIAIWSLVAVLSLAACTESSPTAPSPEPSSPAGVSALADEAASEADVLGGPSASTIPARALMRLVTMGDAYTHGTDTAAPRRDSWPAQLAESLDRSGVTVVLRNLAEPGDTSGQLLEEQLGQVESLRPDVVTLQVGVNDILARETDWYRDNVTDILEALLAILPAERILAITTPDHTLTEWGGRYEVTDAGRAAVDELNATLREVAQERDIEVIDIGQVNALVPTDPALVVQRVPPVPSPSAKQYAGWAEIIGPYVYDALSTIGP